MDFKEITTDILSSLMLSFSKMKVESEQARLSEFRKFTDLWERDLDEIEKNCVRLFQGSSVLGEDTRKNAVRLRRHYPEGRRSKDSGLIGKTTLHRTFTGRRRDKADI